MSKYRFQVGAAVGSGMAARAAEDAGADFILALGAGKLRSMGISSPAALLPIYDAKEFTIEFATSELLPRVQLPVFVGLPLFDPRIDCKATVDRLLSLGIRGVTNFPAVFHFGQRARILEQHGLGLEREIEFLSVALKAGLGTIGYVRNSPDANSMVSAGISTLCINFGLNPPNSGDVPDDAKIDQIALAAKEIVDRVRKPNRNLTIYLGGGPVSGGASMGQLCRKAGIDGFIGGSALDRAPLEKSLLNSVASFREIEVLQNRVKRLERKLHQFSQRYGLVCHSVAMNKMLDTTEIAIKSGTHVTVVGEESTGRMNVARMIAHRINNSTRKKSWEVDITGPNNALDQLFGRARDANNRRLVGLLELSNAQSPIILTGINRLSLENQKKLSRFLTNGDFYPVGSANAKYSDARLIIILDAQVGGNVESAAQFMPLAENLRNYEIFVPPLRDRIEDIPVLVQNFAAEHGVTGDRLQSFYIRTMIRHNWPGNLREFRSALLWLIDEKQLSISEEELIAHIGGTQPPTGLAPAISQRDLIVQALLMNNLSRTKTADYLGVSRKTLYNQIKKYDILS